MATGKQINSNRDLSLVIFYLFLLTIEYQLMVNSRDGGALEGLHVVGVNNEKIILYLL